MKDTIDYNVRRSVWNSVSMSVWESVEDSVRSKIQAYNCNEG
jgi:hypothetical protein